MKRKASDRQALVANLEQTARRLRRDIVEMICAAGSGHPGGSLSAIDFITALYFYRMRYDPQNPRWPERDRFLLSKGHACAALYAVLAEAGFFPREELKRFRKIDSFLQGHVDYTEVPGAEMTGGSLGMGLSVALGMALAARLDGASWRVYAMLGDGECDEGQVWEAAMAAAHHGLDKLTAIVDRNGLQQTRPTEDTIRLEPLEEKWKAFGWDTLTIDGNNMTQIVDALDRAVRPRGKPFVVISRTVKGKGVSFMEGVADFHGRAPTQEELARALAELSCPPEADQPPAEDRRRK
jgi:transketolase